jgi:hypothetical protein
MLLRARQGGRVYEVELPAGSRVEASAIGGAVVVIGGGLPNETCFSIPRSSILEFAREGRYGLVFRGEVPTRTP